MKTNYFWKLFPLITVLGVVTVETFLTRQQNVTAAEPAANSSPFSFVFVGCNRVNFGVNNYPSTANVPQLLQTFTDVASGLPTKPAYLFLCGDIVRNEQSASVLKSQLDAWQNLWGNKKKNPLMGSTTTMIPFPGNHEVLNSVQFAHKQYYEVPNTDSYVTWVKWINDNNHFPQKGNGPAAGGADLLIGDNTKQTYSFDAPLPNGKKAHFVVLNTDSNSSFKCTDSSCYQIPTNPVPFHGRTVEGTMTQAVPGWIAADWATKDIATATAEATVDVIFVLGHKPLVYSNGQTPDIRSDGRDSIFNCEHKQLADQMFSAFKSADAVGKFGGYLCAHKHTWESFQISEPNGPKLWQVIAGNGGSPSPATFGFTYVTVASSGEITATSYDRPVPNPQYGPVGVVPATPGQTVPLRAASQ